MRAGEILFRKKLCRGRLMAFFAKLPPCTVAMEACANPWATQIRFSDGGQITIEGPFRHSDVR